MDKKDMMWDDLLERGVSEETLRVVVSLNGYSEETMKDILYATTGYRHFGQEEDITEDEYFEMEV